MNVKELMLGDIVTFKESLADNEIVPIRIVAIGYQGIGKENEVLATIYGCTSCDLIEIDDEIVGVPITAEILDRNFVKKTFFGLYDDNYDLTIREYCDGMYVVNYHSCDMAIPDEQVVVSYVHQLQHFLRHCGIDKDIKEITI